MKGSQLKINFCSPAPDVIWISPTKEVINDTEDKYAISDFGRVLTILQAEPEYEGFYICKGKGKVESGPQRVFFNVTCKFFVIYVIVATGTLEIHANYINSDHFIIFFTCICQYEPIFMYRGHTKGSYLLVL